MGLFGILAPPLGYAQRIQLGLIVFLKTTRAWPARALKHRWPSQETKTLELGWRLRSPRLSPLTLR